MDYGELMTVADKAEPLRSLIHPDDPRFLHPCDMCEQIRAFCNETDQPVPEEPAEITRCILESLALLYAVRLGELERVTGRNIAKLYIVGGGSQSSLLNQLTADATQREVFAGPVEATAIGNLLVQAMALGYLPDLTTARKLVANSIPQQRFSPRGDARWDEAHSRMRNLGTRLARK
jgi:rhamnulokinase